MKVLQQSKGGQHLHFTGSKESHETQCISAINGLNNKHNEPLVDYDFKNLAWVAKRDFGIDVNQKADCLTIWVEDGKISCMEQN